LLVQNTSCGCDKSVRASTLSCTHLFSSDKFRAITVEKNKGRSVNKKDALEDMEKSDTHS
jgi:hypothetical protein